MSTATQVRTRFAPSPTGELHIGGVRTALFAWLTAKHAGGQFYIRLEDTDQRRYVPGSARRILQTFDWLGIELDGGPDHAALQAMKADEDYPGALEDGSYRGIPGPFVQSQRLPLYTQWAEWLVAHGYAYCANETPEELDAMRKAAEARKETFLFHEDMRLHTDIDPAQPHVIRMRVPRTGTTRFHDLIKGDVAFENAHIDEQVLIKADGFPTYHLAVVVDDHLQEVTHAIRADEWLPSTPKHLLLYQYFGWAPPLFAHVPNVRGEDGKKLSKRHGATSVFDLREQGYIQEAILNFLALLGWAPGEGDEQNVFTVDELIARFSLEHVGSSPAVFSDDKLDWLNGMHIRRLTMDDLAQRLTPFMESAGLLLDTPERQARFLKAVPLIQERIKTLADAPALIDFLFNDIALPPRESLIGQKMDAATSLAALNEARALLAGLPAFEDAPMEQAMRALAERLGLKPGQLFTIVRNAATGKSVTPPLFGTLAALGRDLTLQRLDTAIDVLSHAQPSHTHEQLS
jgi:glutamyl-tRNA synthetase